ncbi:hypothetical protein Tco_0217469 [Tanacetum coccineum]
MAKAMWGVGLWMVKGLEYVGSQPRFEDLTIMAPHGDKGCCTTRPCGVLTLRTWQYNPPRVILVVAVHVLVSYGLGDLAELPLVIDDVPRVAAQRALRVQRASMQDLYEHMGSTEIRHEAIERMEYRHAYHWDKYQGVFEHMAEVYSVSLQGAYNPPGYAQP